MSEQHKGPDGQPQRSLVPYEVGYGRPPAQHRFRKGQSGNPGGRPRKPKPAPVNTGFGMRAAEELLKKEAYRKVRIREGDDLLEMPAIQAVFRAMGVAAVKGNRFVQKTLTEMVAKVEAEDHKTRMTAFENAFEYKMKWEEAIHNARKRGLPEPDPVPHPDDVVLDLDAGGVRVAGPVTREQKARLDHLLKRRSEAQEEVTYFAVKWRHARSAKLKASYLEDWHWEQRMFDIINDGVPERYRAKLQDRSYREGASRPGKVLDELRRSKPMKEEYFG